jgi:hypothetical protein
MRDSVDGRPGKIINFRRLAHGSPFRRLACGRRFDPSGGLQSCAHQAIRLGGLERVAAGSH